MSDEVVLTLADVSVHYGAIKALEGVSFDLRKGEILSIIGSNGGKSTTLRAISGLKKPSKGTIHFTARKYRECPPTKS